MFAVLATAALGASAAYSQALSPESIATSGLLQLSAECRSTVLSLATSPLVECLGVSALLPAISANTSITPILDNWMTEICSNSACDQDLLDSTAQNISMACGSDVAQFDVSGTDIQEIFGLYPLVRELVCLKTTEPFESNSTMSNMTMSSNMTMDTNSTSSNGTFCVTSLLTEVSDYLGMNLTLNSILGVAVGSDTEGRQALMEIPQTALCQDCIYAGAGLIEQQYPGIWNQTIGSGNFTVGGYLNQTCVNETFPEIDREMNNTITLPESIFPSAENSTYAYPIMYSNGTYTPEVDMIQQAPILPFVNVAPAAVEQGAAPTASAVTSLAGPSATPASMSAMTMTTAAAPVASSLSAGLPSMDLPSIASSLSAALPSVSAPVKRDVTAAKRRWVGQQ